MGHQTLISDYIWLFFVFFFRAKIEKEKKKVAQEAGFLRSEITGGEVRKGNLAWNV